MRIGVLEPDGFSSKALSALSDLGEVETYMSGSLSKFLKNKTVLFVRLGFQVNAKFLDMAPKLKIICSPTTAHTHLDELELGARGVTILSLRNEREFLDNIRATPEHTLGMMIAILRNYKSAFLNKDNHCWDRDLYRGEELYGLNVGVIGMGRVGCRVSEYLNVFGSSLFYYDIKPEIKADNCKRLATLEELIEASDLVLISASYANNQSPILDSNLLTMMKGKYLVNTARGELIDEKSLMNFIEMGYFKGVATDVIASENSSSNQELWLQLVEDHNVIVTPHIAGATWTSMRSTEEFIANKLEKYISKDAA